MHYVVRSAVLLELYVVEIHIFQYKPQYVGYHWPIPLDGDSYPGTSVILEEIWTNNFPGTNSTSNSDFFLRHLQLIGLMWIVISSNAFFFLLVYPFLQKVDLVVEDDFTSEIRLHFQLLQRPRSVCSKLLIVLFLLFLGQLNIVRGRPKSWCKIRQVKVCERLRIILQTLVHCRNILCRLHFRL